MAVIILGISMAVLDGTIVNLALPGIVRDLHANAADAVWVITAYQVSTLVMLLPFAMLGDLIGHRRVYLAACRCSRWHRSAAPSRRASAC